MEVAYGHDNSNGHRLKVKISRLNRGKPNSLFNKEYRKIDKFSITIGRLLLGLYFFIPGIRKFTESDQLTAYMQSHDIEFAPQLLWFAGAASVIGGILLMSGRFVKFAAYGFVIYVLLVNLMLHNFWAMSDDLVAFA